MVNAAAGVGVRIEAPDLDLVDAARIRTDAEGAEHGMLRLECPDVGDCRAAAPAAQGNLVLVCGAPTLRSRRSLDDGARLALGAGPIRRAQCRLRVAVGRLRILEHEATLFSVPGHRNDAHAIIATVSTSC